MKKNNNLEGKGFKPGQSGNPKGRPIGAKNRATVLKMFLDAKITHINPLTGEPEKLTAEEFICLGIINSAIQGNVQAFREINDTVYGKLSDKIEINPNPEPAPKTILSFFTTDTNFDIDEMEN